MKHLALLLLTSCTLEASLGKSQVPSSQPALGSTRWSIVLGVSDNEMVDPNGLAFASDGDVIAGGTRWQGDVASFRGFVARRSALDGSSKWQVVLDGTAPSTSQVFAVTTSGTSVIAVGSFTGTIDFGGETRSTSTTTPGVIPASTDLFVASYSADGTLQWVRTLGCTVLASGQAVTASDETIYVGGWYRGLVDVGDGPVGQATDWQEQGDGFLLAYSLSGDFQWGRTFSGGNNMDRGSGIDDLAVLPDGNVLASGGTLNGTSLGGAPMTETGPFIARFSPEGAHEMSSIVGPGYLPSGMTIDGDGNAIVSSYRTAGFTNYNERSLVDANGVVTWTSETPNVHAGHPVAHAPGFVIGGSVGPNVDLGGGVIPLNPMYLAVYDLTGAVVEARSYGIRTNFGPSMYAIASAPSGELAFAVGFTEPIDFDLGPLSPSGNSLAIVLLDAPGSL